VYAGYGPFGVFKLYLDVGEEEEEELKALGIIPSPRLQVPHFFNWTQASR
jgi:hypothetical protein